MKEFNELIAVAKRLNGEGGCPWDREQTFLSLQSYVLEEAHEVIEAVDSQEMSKIVEELGDLFYTVIFYAEVAEREGRFTLGEVIEAVRQKLIRRHPHVFGEVRTADVEEIKQRWEEIKGKEDGHVSRKSALDGIPAQLPSLAKAQKVIQKALRANYPEAPVAREHTLSEKEIGTRLLQLIFEAEESGIHAESALRRTLQDYEKRFRAWEENPNYTQTT
jgi:MazG family protein